MRNPLDQYWMNAWPIIRWLRITIDSAIKYVQMFSSDDLLVNSGWFAIFYFSVVTSLNTCVHVQLLQSCPSLCDPLDCNPPGFSVHGILQARILEWVVMPSSRRSSQPRDITQMSFIAGRFFIRKATYNKLVTIVLMSEYLVYQTRS